MQRKMIKKVCLLGDNAVGKTSLIKKYVFDSFDDKYIATIGTKTVKKELNVDYFGKPLNLTLMIWDILGQKEYRNLQSMSFEGTSAALMVCDITRPETLESLETYWIGAIEKVAGKVPMIFLANKCDLVENTAITEETMKKIAEKYSATFFVTSAKTGENVETSFKLLGRQVITGGQDSEVTIKEDKNKLSPAEVMDNIVTHFCQNFGQDTDYAMSIIRKQCEVVDLDIRNPTKASMSALIDKLAYVEADVLSKSQVSKNKIERKTFLTRM